MNQVKHYLRANAWVRVFLFFLVITPMLMLCGIISTQFPLDFRGWVFGTLGSVTGLVAVRLAKRLDKSYSLGRVVRPLYRTLVQFLFGAGIGLFIFMFIVIFLFAFTPLQATLAVKEFGANDALAFGAVLPLALMEELAFRSYPQQRLANAYGVWVSQIIIALMFALFHLLCGWSILSAFAGPFIWAFLFGLSALWSRGIAMPTGIHFTLNVGQMLAGMKGDAHYTLLKLSYSGSDEQTAAATTDRAGLVIHLALLLLFIFATYMFWRLTGKFRTSADKASR